MAYPNLTWPNLIYPHITWRNLSYKNLTWTFLSKHVPTCANKT